MWFAVELLSKSAEQSGIPMQADNEADLGR